MRKLDLRWLPLLACCLFPFSFALAQGESDAPVKASPVSVDFSACIKSRHVWNGLLSCDAWNMQPDLTISAYGFFFNAWAYFAVGRPYSSEIDLTLGYSWGPFSVGYADFFYPDEGVKFNHYLRWDKKDGGDIHQQYVYASFDGVEKFPVKINWGMLTLGDYERVPVLNEDGAPVLDAEGEPMMEIGKSNYSMYIGLGYSHTLRTGQTLSYAIGGTPYKGMLAQGPNITHITFEVNQPVKITDSYSLDLGGELTFNPNREILYFVLSIGLY